MLHWRRKILRRLRRQLFWSKLFFVSCVGHLFFLFLVLFVRKGDYFSYNVVVNRKALSSGAPVIFLPFHKVVHKKLIAKVVQRKKKKTTIAKPKPKPKKTTKLAVNKKKPAVKKTPTKKVAQKKKIEPKKEKTKVAKKKQTPKKQKKQIVAKKESSVLPETFNDVTPVYVGQMEMEALRMQNEMQTIVSDSWKPPAGLPKNLECSLKILINWNGKATGTVVEKTSGVLMYDISARTAVAHMELPKWAHGKEFNITFKQ